MSRTFLTTAIVAMIAFCGSTALAQTNSLDNSNVQGTGAGGATLSSRFDSDSSRFTGGSTGESGVVGTGSTQAGLNTVTNGAAGAIGGGGGGFGGFGGGLGGFGGGLGGFGGFGGRGGFGGFGGGFGQQGQQGQQGNTQIRTRMVLGFRPTMPVTRVVATRCQDRVNASKRINRLSNISVVMEGQTAVLEGTVGSEHDRKLVGRIVSFEPGVRSVENRLNVGAVPEELPATPSLDAGR